MSLLIIISLIINLVKKKLYLQYKSFALIFFFLVIFLFSNLLFSFDKFLSAKASLGIIRYYLIFFSIVYCFRNVKNFKENYLKSFFFILCFVIIDTLFQYIFGQDIFGYKINYSHGERLSGPFGNELVPGSFISKVFFMTLLLTFFFKCKTYVKYFFILATLVTLILTNERSSSIMFFSFAIFYFLFDQISIKNKFFLILIFTSLITGIFYKNQKIKNHFYDIPKKYFFDNHYRSHFLTGFEIFKDYQVFGSGIKTFRKKCSDSKYEVINTRYTDNRCAMHPHNIYIEFMSDTGLIGIILIFTINLFIFYYIIFPVRKSYGKNICIILLCCFGMLFFPLQTTGSFFSTWNGIFYWICLGNIFGFKKN